MWRVVQHRFILGSDQNDRPNIIWTGGRFKEARGQAKSALFSHMEMIEKHQHFPNADVEIFTNDRYEDGVLVYGIRYEVEEDEADS
jgi:hypothetical protein